MTTTQLTEAPPDLLYLAILTGRLIDALERGWSTKFVVLDIGEEIDRIRAGGAP